ncbi:AraC family transcriptional regulator [Rossellomorea aquimaris]|uniref:AraC family transcriptional regulator n=1 Tax=Rossellomorea aquimaris TaxID=189382 RepID=UPI001CD72666|nr:AraC family transcriptional regulator [Rossellomorea aquimaris]MCA1054113.1 AraC family transcriptional regulator [Rossellomorea aquimaris]
MSQTKTLHIVNGTAMYERFKENQFLERDTMIPFNEAMCYGDTCEDLFSSEFINMRAGVHHVTANQYTDITVKPLQPLLSGNFDHLELWFDEDMFCQLNILTVLALFDQKGYEGEIVLHLVDHRFQPVSRFRLNANGYNEIFKQVLIEKEKPEEVQPSPLKNGIDLYLNYRNETSDLMSYIREHQELPIDELVSSLLTEFKHYGLGDSQYMEIVKTYRERSGGNL